MKCFTSYTRYEPDTVNGHKLVISHIYTTFNQQEMDAWEKECKECIGSGIMTDFEEGSEQE